MSPNVTLFQSPDSELPPTQDTDNVPCHEAALVPPPLPREAVNTLKGDAAVEWWRNTLDSGLREQLLNWTPPQVPAPSTEYAVWLAISSGVRDPDAEIVGWGATPEAAHRSAEQHNIEWMLDPVKAAKGYDTPPNSPWLYFWPEVRFVQLRGERELIEIVARATSRVELNESPSFRVEPPAEALGMDARSRRIAEALRAYGTVLALLDDDELEGQLRQLRRRAELLDPRGRPAESEPEGRQALTCPPPHRRSQDERLTAALDGKETWYVLSGLLREATPVLERQILLQHFTIEQVAAWVAAAEVRLAEIRASDEAHRQRLLELDAQKEASKRFWEERRAYFRGVFEAGYGERIAAAVRDFEPPPEPEAREFSYVLLADRDNCIVGRGKSYQEAVAEALCFETGIWNTPEGATEFWEPGEEPDPGTYLAEHIGKLTVYRLTADDLDDLLSMGRGLQG